MRLVNARTRAFCRERGAHHPPEYWFMAVDGPRTGCWLMLPRVLGGTTLPGSIDRSPTEARWAAGAPGACEVKRGGEEGREGGTALTWFVAYPQSAALQSVATEPSQDL